MNSHNPKYQHQPPPPPPPQHPSQHQLPLQGTPGDMHQQLPNPSGSSYSFGLPSTIPANVGVRLNVYGGEQYGAIPPLGHPATIAAATTASHKDVAQPSAEELTRTNDALRPSSVVLYGRRYELHVVQQPKRARMCGFGDKDRRPITPPPCVQLRVFDAATGKEVDCNDIDYSMFVLNVDLWTENALGEVNLVRHTTTTPSISSTTPASYVQVENLPAYPSNILPSSRDTGYPGQGYGPTSMSPYGASGPYAHGPAYAPNPNGGYAPPTQYYPPHQVAEYRTDTAGMSPLGPHPPIPYGVPRSSWELSQMEMAQRMPGGANQPQGMFTRNLIGSLAASAFRLTDPDDKIGIWFVLQDLSVRTEGSFRLRFSFVNVGPQPSDANGSSSDQGGLLNTGKAPVLASCFSDIFQVYSAKKFPGVCESTPLSKCFASQGIKIPIRKEGASSSKNGGDGDDFDD